ncbi:MAG: ABC transporter ATP-binding protein/permease [Planctomycetes bacterium]|nr:ABC transporter ATP-binding protein/permease [Planctomycetota bacterium]
MSATVATDPAPPRPPLQSWPLLRRLLARFGPYRAAAAGVFVLVLLRTALEIAAPFFVQRAVDAFADGTAVAAHRLPEGYATILAAFAAVLVARAVVAYGSAVGAASLAQAIENRFRSDLFRRVTKLRFRWHDRNRSGKTIARSLRDMERARLFFREVAFGYLELILLLVLGVAGCAVLHPLFGALVALTSVTGFLLTLRVASRIAKMDLAADDEYDHVSTVLQENVAGARVIRAFGREPEESSKFGGRLTTFTGSWHNVVLFWTGRMTWIGSIHHGGLVLNVIAGAWLVGRGSVTPGAVAAVFLIVRALTQRLRNMTRLVIMGQQAVASAARVFEVLENDDVIAFPADPKTLPGDGAARGALRIDDVTFSYVAGTPVLRGVTLHVPAGQSLGILGPTAAGKTTLVQLLPRFYDPDSGSITLDGVDLRNLDPAALTAAVGIVFQEPFLFSATVADNISYGNPGVPRERVVACAKLAAAHEFIEKLPKGYETVVGERGVSLSGGQRQRLTIARALAMDPRVLVFDDATASVDAVTEKELFQGIRAAARGRTTLVISQRITSIRWCDRVAVLDRGTVTAIGTHDELLAASPLYREVFEHQRIQGIAL